MVVGREDKYVCVFVQRGGLMTLHRPLILSERVIIAIKAAWAIETVCVLGQHFINKVNH